MSKNINCVNISGNLTRDSELSQMPSGSAVLRFSVAVNDSMKDKETGEWKDKPNYFDCRIFGSRAEGLAPYLIKGTKVNVSGKLEWHQWETDGQKRTKVDIFATEIELLGGRKNDTKTSNSAYADEDIPF